MTSKAGSSTSASPCDMHPPDDNHGEGIENFSELPAHVNSVREGLLDFDHFLGLQSGMLIDNDTDEEAIPLSAYKPDAVTESQRAREREFVEIAQALVKNAKTAECREDWKNVFRRISTERVGSAHNSSSNMQNSIAWAENEVWHANPDLDLSTIPMPSLYFGFPVLKTDQKSTRGFQKDSTFDNYTLPRLSLFTKHGLYWVPVAECRFEEDGLQPRPVCFPWAIVQVFGTLLSDRVNDSYYKDLVSEASAAASAALSVFETLARFADEKHDGQHIPPVCIITSMGAKTTVWLAYCNIVDDRLRDHKMISIWEGNITKIWDAIQFCRIIDNMIFWAQHCLKPMVTKYIDQWRLRYYPKVPDIYCRLEKDTETAELVHRIQDRFSSLGISPNNDLAALVQQAVMLQEVMRPTGRKEISNLKAEDKSEIIQTSIPNRPREISKEVIPPNQEQSGEDMEKRMKHKPECAEDIQQQDCHSRSGKDDKRITQSFEPHHSLLFQPKSSPKHETTVSVVLGKDKTSSTKEDQKVAEDPRGTLTEPSFSNSGQIKTSSSEERRKPLLGTSTGPDYADLNLVQRTLHSMAYRVVNGHVLPLEKQQDRKSNLTLQEKEKLDTNRRLASDKESTNTDRPSPPPNPFSLETFDMGFKATLCVGLGIRVPSVLKLPQRHRHGPYPILRLGVVQHDAFINLDCRRIRIVPEPTVIDPLPPPPLNIRIPWRGKNILVKFPPAKPAAVLPLRRTESLEQ